MGAANCLDTPGMVTEKGLDRDFPHNVGKNHLCFNEKNAFGMVLAVPIFTVIKYVFSNGPHKKSL